MSENNERFEKIFGASANRFNSGPSYYKESDSYNDYRKETNNMVRDTSIGSTFENAKMMCKSFKKVFTVGVPVSVALTTAVLTGISIADYKKQKKNNTVNASYKIIN